MAGQHLPDRLRGQPMTRREAAEMSRRIRAWPADDPVPVGPPRAAAIVVVAGLAGCLAILLVPLWLVLR